MVDREVEQRCPDRGAGTRPVVRRSLEKDTGVRCSEISGVVLREVLHCLSNIQTVSGKFEVIYDCRPGNRCERAANSRACFTPCGSAASFSSRGVG
ncbi:uncharacterized protein MYCFIDRAFT_173860 [Pseudocercospora fijiensis CIRAD86]|uniref:Uncharacterized protein n=1 Tax=Pseudocercospora fijiensis (strain CIRAD86) TaxID=383855 RepID=M3B6K0_PSEFD|nr:uncharacterized protein MYCFIDRAFT_173860 [Pseudocercospora fijiensis CIRAD86]EME84982.1 hypothetical protein MYCFIDRAFT_173860 [Pseudocercospora fijiensis CIRAD86]